MAARYWSGNATPTSFNWNYNSGGITNWGSASGVADNVLPPTSADDVFFDGVGVKGNSNSIVSAIITVLSFTVTSGYTATMTHNAVLTIAGNVTLNTSYTIAGTSSITISAASTITSNGKTWPNSVFFTGINTKTLNGDFTIGGLLATNTNQITTINQTGSNTLRCNGLNLAFNGGIVGTATLRLTGGSFVSGGGGSIAINTNLIFDGNITLVNLIWFSGASFTKVSGTITGSVALTILSTCTLDLAGITWASIVFPGGTVTVTLNSLLTTSGTASFNSVGGTSSLAGTFGFSVGTLIPPAGGNLSLKNGVTYIINNALSSATTNVNTITSDSGTLRANLTLVNNATCSTRQSFTRINATGGRPINAWNGTITDCVNIRTFTDLQTVASSSIT